MLKFMGRFKSQHEAPPLSEEKVATALATHNREIITELYSLTLRLYNGEGDRTKTLDSKASALFGFVGAFISAIFVVLGFLAAKDERLSLALSGWPFFLIVIVLGMLGLSLINLFFSVVVHKGWRAPAERDLIEAVKKYDGHVDGDATNPEKPAHDYKRHLIEHFWKLYRTCFAQNEKKAKALFWAQLFVFFGLLLLVVVQVKAVLAFNRANMASQKSSPIIKQPSPGSQSPPSASTSTNGRPAPLPVSSKEETMHENNDRPKPLVASTDGQHVRLSKGRPAPLAPSGQGRKFRNDDEK